MDLSPGAEHTALTQWAVSHGINIKGIAPARFPGRGLGMVATRVIRKNETMLSVPVNLMLTRDSIPKSFVSLFPEDAMNHALLVALLCHGDSTTQPGLDIWRRVWPSWEDFETSMPIFWPGWLRRSNPDAEDTAQSRRATAAGSAISDSDPRPSPNLSLLPPSISGLWNTIPNQNPKARSNSNSEAAPTYTHEIRYQNLLPRQEKRLLDTWDAVRSVFPETDWKSFAYNWAIINSRSFYYLSPGKEEPTDWNDAIGMVPFADYFNHADDAACEVTFDGDMYRFQASRRYEKGEEVYMSYGAHSNDFLLVEYGFCPDQNPSDGVYLDDIILPELTRSERKELAEREHFGNYEITASGADSSTMAAASIKYMSRSQWRDHVDGASDRGFDASKTASVVRGWIEIYQRECNVTITSLEELLKSEKEKEKVALTLARWKQIQRLCECAVISMTD
ncbi:uncharacterized protein DSM5745_06109 [Aspergillus mulundensis]|uniref:SET domain-containing protein n=1 Tax=Aspergillus mulundensis TaxID=1810919 RepID=A0A3D8RYX0_9EURO|nr:Uncharacterized protein DSM5745_06109 [Aspergillus mulundensis]RDW79257.1 Uncharacterized protein DSM5745_06109 [Aspergillus mulundensis]